MNNPQALHTQSACQKEMTSHLNALIDQPTKKWRHNSLPAWLKFYLGSGYFAIDGNLRLESILP